MKAKEFRIERDPLGQVKVPLEAYYGPQTQRAVENFPISGLRLQPVFIRALATIKLAAARTNMTSGKLEKKIGKALEEASVEVIDGKWYDQFVIDVFQAGAGTSQNMNMNEVLANRAAEILGGARGDYSTVHPNDHANMGQSTNDIIHAAIHIAAVTELNDSLLPAVRALRGALHRKASEFDHIVKTGRTHLQDAVPIRLGQEFGAYAAMMKLGEGRLERSSEALMALPIGGTAVGTGLNTDPGYRQLVTREINDATGLKFVQAEDPFEAMQSMDAVLDAAGNLRVLVTSLRKIADDLRLLSSGPRTGLAEIKLPDRQPGSSIMPGKINPVMAEMLDMVCFHALGCDTTILTAAQAGQLELNVMMPVIAYNLLQEIEILTGGVKAFTELCVAGITAEEVVCRDYAERSTALATALGPGIGYDKASELAKEALEKDLTVRDLVLSRGILDSETVARLLDIRRMTEDPAGEKKKKPGE